MNGLRIAGIALLVLGVVALAFGGFSYTKTNETDLGPIEIQTKDRETVPVPLWAGIGAVIVGAGLLVAGGRKA